MEPVLPFAPDLSGAAGHLMGTLHQQLRAAILDGRLAAGATLPASRKLAAELGIARNTVTGAYDLLVAEGYVVPRQGAKPVVADLHTRQRVAAAPPTMEDPRLAPFWRTPWLPPAPRALPERSFRLGVPDHRHFPHALWRKLTAQALQAFSKRPFTYPPSQGLPELRSAIAQHVAFARAVACTGEDVVVTSGAQQAFDLLARLLVTPGETRVAVEEPGYPPVRAAFAAAGAVLVPTPVDDEGLCVECMPDDVRVISVTPSHQSPTGAALSLRRRMALLDYARARNAVVIEDDYDGEFRFGGRPLDALQTLDRDGLVCYVGTFTKSLFPALRKGFVVAPAWARAPLAAIKYGADPYADAVTQAVLAAFIRDGHLARHVRKMRSIYAERRIALLEGLAAMDAWMTPIPSEAGLHTAVRIRDPEQMPRILALVREHTPGAQSAAEYAMGPLREPVIAFGYSVIDVEEIRARMAALRAALARQVPV
ncbi:PLP-dependent aminotransferase family protein [Lysobacter sp. KIS68-7]|uniref:MocR-like pyridoxine biosynthesis transcription factor PdxR n=1 Tax=Lysobacter sp. KIS68-7 TaxID=2904252 RepID=UPI001E384219|nr:PLP-dependent aminotransferase family protein [Lysobacter sp. KIS68-7]UHQ18531.1 PLP-dependent aminotransferase family protein [Lysobacter sp. KIS68-7]